MRAFFCLIAFFSILNTRARYFEGRIGYANEITTKSRAIDVPRLTGMYGTKPVYYFSGDRYSSALNAAEITSRTYDPKSNRIYSKKPGTDTIFWADAAGRSDSLLKTVMNTDTLTILGYACASMTFFTDYATVTYYYSKKLPLDPSSFRHHHYDNWDVYALKAKAVPLKIVTETTLFIVESTATEIKKEKVSPAVFAIDPKAPLLESY